MQCCELSLVYLWVYARAVTSAFLGVAPDRAYHVSSKSTSRWDEPSLPLPGSRVGRVSDFLCAVRLQLLSALMRSVLSCINLQSCRECALVGLAGKRSP